MRRVFWVLLLSATTLFAFWVVLGPWTPQGPIETGLVLLFFGVHPFGAFWMVYRCIRYEEKPFRTLLMAFVAYGFVWYYVERVRRGESDKRRQV